MATTKETPATATAETAADEGVQHPAATPSPDTAEGVVAAQRKEYGQFVAAQRIYSGSALIYNPLDPVPATNVELHGYLEAGLVVKTGSKAHDQLRQEVLGQ